MEENQIKVLIRIKIGQYIYIYIRDNLEYKLFTYLYIWPMVSMFITELLTGRLSWRVEVDRVPLVDAVAVEWFWSASFRYKVDGGPKDIDRGSMFTKMIGIMICILLSYIAPR